MKRSTGSVARRLCLVLALALTGAVASAPASSANPSDLPGSIGVRLLDVPSALADDPRAHLYIVDHLAPGAAITRPVEVSNTTNADVRVVLYAAAAAVAGGTFRVSAGHTPDALSTWTEVHPGTRDIPAGGRITAVVTISVPADAAPGEQYGVVWAEARSAPASGIGLTQVSRVGIRLYLSIGLGNPPAADFSIESLSTGRTSDGAPLLHAMVRNTGGRALDLSGTLRLGRGPGGLAAGPFPATLGTTLGLGDSSMITVVLDKLVPAGPWDARLTMRSGLVEHTSKARLTFPAFGQAGEVDKPGGRLRLLLLVAGGVLVLLAGLVAVRRRRRPSMIAGGLPS